MFTLRPYQEQAVSNVIAAIKRGIRRIIIRAGTGAGKTVIASRIIHGSQAKGKRVLFLAHRAELIFQCSQKLHDMDVHHGIIMGQHPQSATAKVHIASVSTLVNRQYPDPDIIIIDECHHARAGSYEKIIARYPKALLIGLTATPARLDGKGLGTLFDEIVDVSSYTDLIEAGYLVPFRIFEPTQIDFRGVDTCAGDFNKKQAHERLAKSKIYGDAIEQWQKLAKDRSTILFASCVADSKRFVDSFRAIGVVADHVDGTTKPEARKKIFDDFRAGRTQVLCNVGVATEGTDLPIASCISLCNPTKSLVLHHQMVGRGLRINPGKLDCIILDHVGNHGRLGWIDDEILWTLDCQKKAVNKTRSEATAPIRTCPKCYYCMRGGANVCERCGHEFKVKSRELKKVDAELKEATRSGAPKTYTTHKDELTFLAEKMLIARRKSYRPGWAMVQFKMVFGRYPRLSNEDVRIRIMELEMEERYG
jgi:DNA repair protein RadD